MAVKAAAHTSTGTMGGGEGPQPFQSRHSKYQETALEAFPLDFLKMETPEGPVLLRPPSTRSLQSSSDSSEQRERVFFFVTGMVKTALFRRLFKDAGVGRHKTAISQRGYSDVKLWYVKIWCDWFRLCGDQITLLHFPLSACYIRLLHSALLLIKIYHIFMQWWPTVGYISFNQVKPGPQRI